MTADRPALRRLLYEAIDYAGLYPPARLRMPEAVLNYSVYRTGGMARMLGRLVVPAARLPELREAVHALRSPPRTPWRVSATGGDDLAADLAAIEAFNGELDGAVRVDSFELRLTDPADVGPAVRRARERLQVFVEFPLREDPEPFLRATREAGAFAKARTGGITPESIPSVHDVARFIGSCADAAMPFKATAGLHHPLRAEYPLDYEAGSPRATMHGFLNVLLAAALARGGARGAELEQVLEERDAGALAIDDGIRWGEHYLSEEDLRSTRGLMLSFGSCSFTEPVEELGSLQPS